MTISFVGKRLRVVLLRNASGARALGFVILVVVPYPRHGPRQLRLVAALRHEVEVIIGADQNV